MTSKINPRLKRKNEFSDKNIEPSLKALKKDDIIAHYTSLLAKYNILEQKNIVLEKEKITHLESIRLLEETVNVLEEKINPKIVVDKQTKESQTDAFEMKNSDKEIYLCGDCDYVAECMHDFNDHTHTQDQENIENLSDSLFTCKFCDERFETLSEVMIHNRLIHTRNVQHCKQYLENSCFYGDNCWFIHSETFRNSEPTFKCNFCELKFRSQNVLREHTKLLHTQFVFNCKNEDDCKFRPKKCWFIHKEDIEIAYQSAKSEGQID